jgi:hypothetical protein
VTAVICMWFALCENPTTNGVQHPALGLVPCCDRCASKLDMSSELVPVAQALYTDGRADFTTLDSDVTMRCGRERLCGLCGESLTYWIAFIGGPRSADTRTYSDPPMHVECAEDAFTLCPHLRRPLVARRESDGGSVPAGWSEDKPETWVMGITRDYSVKLVPLQGGGVGPLFIAKPWKRTRTWAYRDGEAVELDS